MEALVAEVMKSILVVSALILLLGLILVIGLYKDNSTEAVKWKCVVLLSCRFVIGCVQCLTIPLLYYFIKYH